MGYRAYIWEPVGNGLRPAEPSHGEAGELTSCPGKFWQCPQRQAFVILVQEVPFESLRFFFFLFNWGHLRSFAEFLWHEVFVLLCIPDPGWVVNTEGTS